jgi:hypothetical protein
MVNMGDQTIEGESNLRIEFSCSGQVGVLTFSCQVRVLINKFQKLRPLRVKVFHLIEVELQLLVSVSLWVLQYSGNRFRSIRAHLVGDSQLLGKAVSL